MKLPQMKYQGNGYQTQVVQFRGLNRRPEPADGEYTAGRNLTTQAFPYLAPRRARTTVEQSGTPTAIFGWDKLVVVADGKLYLENEEICKVSDAPKQFAVVNSKLIVWPDKLQIDLTNHEVKDMTAGNMAQDTAAKFTPDTLEFSALPVVERNVDFGGFKASSDSWPWVNAYGYDADKIVWDDVNGWTSDGATPLTPEPVCLCNGKSAGAIIIPNITVQEDGSYKFDITNNSVKWSSSSMDFSGSIPRDDENNLGIFGILQRQPSYGTGDPVDAIMNLYQAGQDKPVASLYFEVGDRIEIKGPLIQANSQKAIKIISLTDGKAPAYENVLQFEGQSFLCPTEYFDVEEIIPAGEIYTDIRDPDDRTRVLHFKIEDSIPSGDQLLYWKGEFSWKNQKYEPGFYRWDESKRILHFLAAGNYMDVDDTGDLTRFTEYDRETETLKIGIPVPDLDYICEKDNRLWGVSNKADNEVYDPETGEYRHYTSRVLYASALGLPHRFFDFDGTAADSFQVAVASEGDFTGIIGYSDSVVAMKEDKVYRVFGDYPAAYQMYEYTIPGCAKGSHASLQIIGEILYYAGRNGIYAYDGAAPHLMSYPLGDVTYEDAVAGTDGVRYYLSAKAGGTWDLFVYDTVHGIWTREDETQAIGFALVEGTLHLAAGNKIYKLEQEDGSETVQWSARFEALKEGSLQRKRWKWLRLRIRLEDGAWMKVYYTPDNGEKTLAEQLSGAGTYTVSLPLTPMRCDRLTIDLEAQGRGQVQAMERAFYLGSKV